MEPLVPLADGEEGLSWVVTKTIGDWPTEQESAYALDGRLESQDLWTVYREIPGVLLQPRLGQVDRQVRIDRILIPNERLCKAGWRHGAIGIEIKRSGEKLGPPLAQAMDYTRSAWTIKEARGISVILSMVFVWPMPKQYGPLASILVHNRIGSASFSAWTSLYLQFGDETILHVNSMGQLRLGSGNSGRKVGSR